MSKVPVKESTYAPYEGRHARLELAAGRDLWVFGYGSLIWNPGFPHLEVRRGRLHGYHRGFCVYSHVYRGSPECPGLVLGLDRGGSCEGLVFRVPEAEAAETLDYLYDRELVTDVYIPRWLTVKTEAGPTVRAAGFIVDRAHLQYAGRLGLEETVGLVLQGQGRGGSCADYLAATVHHLEALDLADRPLRLLLREVAARRGAGSRKTQS
jgi:cation transport protein ChaC